MELSFKRLGLLLKKQLIENKNLYLLGILAMMGVMGFVFLSSVMATGLSPKEQGLFLDMGMITFGCLFTLTLFAKLDKKEGRIQILTLPATTLEKLVCAIIYGAFLFPIIYLASVYPILRFANYIDNNYMGRINEAYAFNVTGFQASLLFVFYLMQTLVLLFSVWIKQYKVAVSAGILSFLFFGMVYFYPKVIAQFTPDIITGEIKVEQRLFDENKILTSTKTITLNQTFSGRKKIDFFGELRYFNEKSTIALNIPPSQRGGFTVFFLLTIPFMWLITWFKLKEAELS